MAIEGHWVGSYFQEFYPDTERLKTKNEQNVFPIEAWFEQHGNDITGRMLDLRPERELPYDEFIKGNHFANWLLRLRAKAFVAKHPDCLYRMCLAPESSLKGKVEGSRISFTKIYSWPSANEYSIGGKVTTSWQGQNPPIEYVGELSEDGGVITGTYSFSGVPHLPQDPRAIQTFELQRA